MVKNVSAQRLWGKAKESIRHGRVHGKSRAMPAHVKQLVEKLRIMGAPKQLLQLVLLIGISERLDVHACVDSLETFAGKKEVTKAFSRAGAVAVDFELDRGDDILDDDGFILAVLMTMKLRAGGAALSAPVCSTWVWINRATSKRSTTSPLGDVSVPSVKAGNIMVARVILLLMICHAKGIWWVLEQPLSSIMEMHPSFQALVKLIPVFKHTISMKNFGAETRKPTILYSSHAWISDIDDFECPCKERMKAKQTTYKDVDSYGRLRTSGLHANLKSTQAYPRGFGQAIAKLWTKRRAGLRKEAVMKKDCVKKSCPEGLRAEFHRATTLAELDSVIDVALLIAGH